MNFLAALDKKIFLWVNGQQGGLSDYFFGWPTLLITPIFLIFVLIFMFIWDGEKILKKFGRVLLSALAGGFLMPAVLKQFIDKPRPFNAFYDDIAQGKVVVHTMFQLFLSNSFPSGHTALVFAVVTALNLLYKNKLLYLYIPACFLSVTRVYVGAHFPSDVLAGAVSGILGAYLAGRWMPRTP